MSVLIIRLFGKFSVEYGSKGATEFNGCKVQELFSYLLLNRNRPHSREFLAGLLWGNSTTEKSKKYLRQTLWHLQSALDCQKSQGPSGLQLRAEHDWVQVDTNGRVWLDVAILEEAFRLIQEVRGYDTDLPTLAMLKKAVEIYRGDLLEGCYQDWCLYEREVLQNKYLMILDKLLGYSLAHHEYDAGQRYGELILRYDRAREITHRVLMRLQYEAGDRTGALRQYKRCVRALREELGVRPDQSTRALFEEICGSTKDAEAPGADEPANEPDALLPEILDRLKHLQHVIARVQLRLNLDIKAIEVGLKTFKR